MSLVTPNVFLLLQLNRSKDQEGSGCIPYLSYFKRTPVRHLGEEGVEVGGGGWGVSRKCFFFMAL